MTDLRLQYEKINHVPGWFSFEDAVTIYECMPSDGLVVEVGSFAGKSSRFISFFADVICIDPLKSTNDHFISCVKRAVGSETVDGNFESLFYKYAIKENENGHRVKIIKNYDFDVWDSWSYGKIGLLCIDHHHSERSVCESLVNWRKNLTKDAFVVVHDAMHKGVLAGIASSNICVHKVVRESLYCPAVCKWSPTFL